MEFKSLLQDIDRGDVEMFRSSWVGDYNDAYTFAQYLKSDFGVNLPHYQARPTTAARAAADEVDPGKRRALLEQAESVMLGDHPLLPIYFYVNKHLVKPEVVGWYDNVMNVVYSRRPVAARPHASPETFGYLPMQKPAKIRPRRSSLVNSPVIWLSACCAARSSSATSSPARLSVSCRAAASVWARARASASGGGARALTVPAPALW